MKRIIFSCIAAVAMLAALVSCNKNSVPETVEDNTDYRPTADQIDVTIPFSSYISEGEFQGSTKHIVDRLKSKKPVCDDVMLVIFNNSSIEKLSDNGYSLLTEAMADGAMLLMDCPTSSILEKVRGRISDCATKQIASGAASGSQADNLYKVLSYLDALCEAYKDAASTSAIDYVAVSSYSIYTTLAKVECTVTSNEIDENGDIVTKSGEVTGNVYNAYDYGKMADRFATTFNTECAAMLTNGDTGINPAAITSHLLLPVVYDLRKVSYERESSQVVPAMNMELTRTVLPVYTPGDQRDHYIVNQVLVVPFRDQGVKRGRYWWQIGRRHYGPYMTSLEVSNSLKANDMTPNGLWINNSKPTNTYSSKTYSESSTIGVSGGVVIGEKPSVNLGLNYSEGTSVAQTCPVVKTEDRTSNTTPNWIFTLNQGRPQSHRDMDYNVHHDELDETIFQNHTFAQSWEWVFPSGVQYAGAKVKDNLHIKLVQEDLGWDWADWTHLETEEHYNSLTFEFDNELVMPYLERAIQKWNIFIEDCADEKTKSAVRDILMNHVEGYFDKTFSLPTLRDEDTSRINKVIEDTCTSVNNNYRSFQSQGVKSFTLRWQRADSDKTYKQFTFNF